MDSPRTSDSLRKEFWLKSNEYHNQLRGSNAEHYLLEERKFTQEAIDHFRLGYVETPMKGDQSHQGRIVVPYMTRTGVVSLRSRSMPAENGGEYGSKYLPWLTGDTTRPFNTPALDTAAEVVITEGEFDAITAWILGLHSIGIPGVANWKSVFRPIFRHRKVYVVGDSDDQMQQGENFAKKVAKDLGGAAVLMPPKGYDLNSYYAEHGVELTLKMLGFVE